MYLVAIGWIYVVLMMAAAELTSPSGTVLGAVVTLLLYGLLPVSLLMYIMATPMRNKARRQRERDEQAKLQSTDKSALDQPDSGGHPPGDAVAPVGKEP
ncbi:MAG: hypothetical protein ABI564_03865 [Ideonella sp.]